MKNYDAAAAARVHFATDNERISALAEAMYRQRTGRSADSWLRMVLDDQRALRMEARNWLRAAVAAGLLAAPTPDEWESLNARSSDATRSAADDESEAGR